MHGRLLAVVHHAEEQIGGGAADLFGGLGDVGDSGAEGAGEMEVVEADKGELGREADAVFLEGFVDEDDKGAVGAKNGVDGIGGGKGEEEDLFGLSGGMNLAFDEEGEGGGGDGFGVSADAFAHGVEDGVGDEAKDAFAAVLDKMAGGIGHGLAIIGEDTGEPVLLEGKIDGDGGRSQLVAVLLKGDGLFFGRDDEEAVDAVLLEDAELLELLLFHVERGGKDEDVLACAADILRDAGDGGVEGVGDAGDDKADGAGALVFERASGEVGLIAELADDVFNAKADVGSNELAAVDDAGDGGGADTGEAGDIANCGSCVVSHAGPESPEQVEPERQAARAWRERYLPPHHTTVPETSCKRGLQRGMWLSEALRDDLGTEIVELAGVKMRSG